MKSTLPYFRNFPGNFKKEVVAKIIAAAQKRRNLQLIGLKGSGKSLLFRYLSLKPEVLKDFNVYQIDFNLAPDRTAKAVSELLLEEMRKREDEMESFGKMTLILADSFENVADISGGPPAGIFKAFSDRFRDYISFIFSVDRPIGDGNVYWGEAVYMTPLSESDFDWFWRGIGGGKEHKNKIYKASGGHMAVAKRLWEIASCGGDLDAVLENPRLNPHLLYQLELMKEKLGENKNYFDVPVFETFVRGAGSGKELTALEFKAFRYLNENKRKIVDRENLIKVVWGEYASQDVADHALDQLMHRLKLKLAKEGAKIETVRGRGHRLLD